MMNVFIQPSLETDFEIDPGNPTMHGGFQQMRIPVLFHMAVACLIGLTAAAQDAPGFLPGRLLESGGRPMMGDNLYTTVAVCDWNDDGRKDLLVGMLYDGNVKAFLDVGTGGEPAFGPGVLLEADGYPIQVGYA